MYRTDPATGDRVGVLPRTCKRGLHDLYRSGYTPQMRGESLLAIACIACRDVDHSPDYAWSLTTSGPPPARAELDDKPYEGHQPQFQQVKVCDRQ